MRPSALSLRAAACALLAACVTRPAPVPDAAPAQPPPARAEPFALSDLKAAEQSMLGARLSLAARFDGAPATEIRWIARVGERELGSGTAPLAAGPEGTWCALLQLSYGSAAADLAPFQAQETMEVVVEAAADAGGTERRDTRSLHMRAPHIPEVYMLSVQASREPGNNAALDLTYLLAAKNPNLFDVRASGLHYTAMLGGREVSQGDLPLGDRIPAAAENTWEIPAVASTENMGRDFPAKLRSAETMPWAFAGSLRVGGIDVPVDLKGELKLSKQ